MSKILYEQRGAIAEVALNRPDKLNAVDEDMLVGRETALNWRASQSQPAQGNGSAG